MGTGPVTGVVFSRNGRRGEGMGTGPREVLREATHRAEQSSRSVAHFRAEHLGHVIRPAIKDANNGNRLGFDQRNGN